VADSSHDLAWAAGLFEGEGYVEHRPNGCGRTTRGLGLAMTDLDVVERFQKVVGVGAVRGPYTNRRNKPLYVWKVGRWGDVEPLARQLLPLMGARRREAILALLNDPPLRVMGTCKRCGGAMKKMDGEAARRCPQCRRNQQRAAHARRRAEA
jgi:hypothetical protein